MSDPSVLRRKAEERTGTVLRGKYRLEALLGIGGMSAVYRAVHRNGHRVAVKMLHDHVADSAGARRRFLQEGYAANNVDHPGVVRVLDDDVTEDGTAFVVMELLEGETLGQQAARRGGTLPPETLLSAVHQLLDVLAAAERKGIIHRDIKPDNVFVTAGGAIKLLDFGLAKVMDGSVSATTTTSHGVFGTLGFMPPEQALGNRDEMDARSDIFAVGATMFTLLSGKRVHEATGAGELLLMAVSRQARSVATVAPHLPPDVVRIVDKALRFSKEERWESALAMQRAVAEVLSNVYKTTPGQATAAGQGATAGHPTAAVPAPQDTIARRRWLGLGALALAVLVIASAAAIAVRGRGDERLSTTMDDAGQTVTTTGSVPAATDTGQPAASAPAGTTAVTASTSSAPAPQGGRPPASGKTRKPGRPTGTTGAFDYQ